MGAQSDDEVARAMFLGRATVKTYLNRLLSKLRQRGRVQAVVLADETGLIQLGDETGG
uniref:LuxR C-terminal-related transcriptional regulator n=1 Tax=Paractinoplanes polyasparticus TaxID=2856853 RepID=UPI002107863E|nr:LuxR C-terminal-related transcriptional regulator [Actinoplanes polyasparticus]